jgi:hypothetical protein
VCLHKVKRRYLVGNIVVVRRSVIDHVFMKPVQRMSTLKQKRRKMKPVTENKDVHCVVKYGYERNFKKSEGLLIKNRIKRTCSIMQGSFQVRHITCTRKNLSLELEKRIVP